MGGITPGAPPSSDTLTGPAKQQALLQQQQAAEQAAGSYNEALARGQTVQDVSQFRGTTPQGQTAPQGQAGPTEPVGPVGQGTPSPVNIAAAGSRADVQSAINRMSQAEQLALGTKAADTTGLPHLGSLTYGEVMRGTWPIPSDVQKVAFGAGVGAKEGGPYSFKILTAEGALYTTPAGAWQLMQMGQIKASGSAGSLGAILAQPGRYARDVEAMGLVPQSRETQARLQAVGAVPSTITSEGGVFVHPVYSPQYQAFSLQAQQARQNVESAIAAGQSQGWTVETVENYNRAALAQQDVYGRALAGGVIVEKPGGIAGGGGYLPGADQVKTAYDVVSGRTIVQSGQLVKGETFSSPVLAAPFIAGVKPTVVTGPSGIQPPGAAGAQGIGGRPGVPTGTTLTQLGGPADTAGNRIMAVRETLPFAGTPLAPLGAAYVGAERWYERVQRENVKPITTQIFPAVEGWEQRFQLWGTAAVAMNPFTGALFAAQKTSQAITGEQAPWSLPETMAAYPGETYRGVREQPLTMATMYALPFGFGVIGDVAGTSTGAGADIFQTAHPTLYQAGTWANRAMIGMYGISSGARIATSPEPSRETARITATELTPLMLGAASYPLARDVAVKAGGRIYEEAAWFRDYTVPKIRDEASYRLSNLGERLSGYRDYYLGGGERLTAGPEPEIPGLREVARGRDVGERITRPEDIWARTRTESGAPTTESGRGGQVLVQKTVQVPVVSQVPAQAVAERAAFELGTGSITDAMGTPKPPWVRSRLRLLEDEQLQYNVLGFTALSPKTEVILRTEPGTMQSSTSLLGVSSISATGQVQSQAQPQFQLTKTTMGLDPLMAIDKSVSQAVSKISAYGPVTLAAIRARSEALPVLDMVTGLSTETIEVSLLTQPQLSVPTMNVPQMQVPIVPIPELPKFPLLFPDNAGYGGGLVTSRHGKRFTEFFPVGLDISFRGLPKMPKALKRVQKKKTGRKKK